MMPCFRFLRSGGEREKRRKRGVFVEVFEVSDEGSAPVSLTLPCFLSLSLSLSLSLFHSRAASRAMPGRPRRRAAVVGFDFEWMKVRLKEKPHS